MKKTKQNIHEEILGIFREAQGKGHSCDKTISFGNSLYRPEYDRELREIEKKK